jgi:hypothetical protein
MRWGVCRGETKTKRNSVRLDSRVRVTHRRCRKAAHRVEAPVDAECARLHEQYETVLRRSFDRFTPRPTTVRINASTRSARNSEPTVGRRSNRGRFPGLCRRADVGSARGTDTRSQGGRRPRRVVDDPSGGPTVQPAVEIGSALSESVRADADPHTVPNARGLETTNSAYSRRAMPGVPVGPCSSDDQRLADRKSSDNR